jgi:hypothetical protein
MLSADNIKTYKSDIEAEANTSFIVGTLKIVHDVSATQGQKRLPQNISKNVKPPFKMYLHFQSLLPTLYNNV